MLVQMSASDRLILITVVKNKSAIGQLAFSPVGTAENSPGRQSWVGLSTAISPVGTTENEPGRQSWVNWTTRECYGNHPRPTRFSPRPPIAYNPRIICTLNRFTR